jgi:hypothetical protein
MPANTPLQGLPYSIGSDAPGTIDNTMQALAEALEKKLVQVYDDVADRDATITAPENGMVAVLTIPGEMYLRVAGAWQRIYPAADTPSITSSSSVPANTTGSDGDIHFVI